MTIYPTLIRQQCRVKKCHEPSTPYITPQAPEDGSDEKANVGCECEEWTIEFELRNYWCQD